MGVSVGRVETQRAVLFTADRPLALDSGAVLAPVEVAYETYGRLDADRSNAIVVCHALTGDAHAAGHHGDPAKRGWWDSIIGPGRPLDTDRFFVVCSNLLGGCQGTTGPSSTDPATGRPYGLRFPLMTISDLVRVHRALIAHLGIERPLAAVGGSLGGMQALQWALDAPGELESAVVICASSRLSAQNIAFSAVAREAIMGDPDFHGGDYYEHGVRPDRGLATARMLAHITYLSEESMRRKFGRRLQDRETPRFGFDVDFQVESYLRHQGASFLRRFDANSYLYLTRVMDYFDAFADPVATARALEGTSTRFLVVSFDSDWRFDTAHSREIVRTLTTHGAPVTFREVASPFGHDSFLLDIPDYHRTVGTFLQHVHSTPAGVP
ncbi:homoserine O-acetyltransferase MetX [Miltoncostaea marina]|uniref:homoserine O-acetyltransferase MetX n=1 Tax=Miltoncostaea marina TaxID=2843215 RepID=UPI001C3D011C|nr:homoserine O-acetyltransferase [Miltoncostaea marina]